MVIEGLLHSKGKRGNLLWLTFIYYLPFFAKSPSGDRAVTIANSRSISIPDSVTSHERNAATQ